MSRCSIFIVLAPSQLFYFIHGIMNMCNICEIIYVKILNSLFYTIRQKYLQVDVQENKFYNRVFESSWIPLHVLCISTILTTIIVRSWPTYGFILFTCICFTKQLPDLFTNLILHQTLQVDTLRPMSAYPGGVTWAWRRAPTLCLP